MNHNDFNNHLTDEEKRVLFEKGTEAPFSGELLHEKREGGFRCKVCHTLLFDSQAKFDSGTGWPSFDQAIKDAVTYVEDTSLGMSRVEVVCKTCKAHLGHVFPDGITATGTRYCINSVCLAFEEKADSEQVSHTSDM